MYISMLRCSLKAVLTVLASTSTLCSLAQTKQESREVPICIVDEIMADSINVVELPFELRELIDYSAGSEKKGPAVVVKPFTVQVYSDKSRDEANARAAKVQARFPQYHVRRHYSSPYFRVYLGAFESSKEAQVLVNEVKKAFPTFANEVHWTKTSSGSSRNRGR